LSEIDEIRKRKLAELQQRVAAQEAYQDPQAQAADRARQQLHALEQMLRQFLTADAWEQWNNAKLANSENAYMAAQSIVQMGQAGRLNKKLGREEIKEILRVIISKTRREITIKGMSVGSTKPKKSDKSGSDDE